MNTRRLMGMAALCAAPGFVLAASAPAVQAPADRTPAATLQVAAATTGKAGAARDSVADSHLLLQYALHRSSRYLYNPGDGAQLAGAAGHLDTVEH